MHFSVQQDRYQIVNTVTAISCPAALLEELWPELLHRSAYVLGQPAFHRAVQFNIIRLVTIVSLVARLCRAAAAVLGVLYGTISENNVHVQKHITWGSGDTSTPSAIPDSISNIIFFIISSGKQQLPSCRTREIPIPFVQRNGYSFTDVSKPVGCCRIAKPDLRQVLRPRQDGDGDQAKRQHSGKTVVVSRFAKVSVECKFVFFNIADSMALSVG